METSPNPLDAAPTPGEWQKFLGRALGILAAGSLLASAVCFIAYNWGHMGPLFKLGLIEALMLGLAALSWRLDCEAWPGQLAVFCAVFLVGPLLAVYGQAYPTGAPLSMLLYTWAFVSALAALLVRTEGLWLLTLAVLNAAFFHWGPFSNGEMAFFGGKSTRFIVMGLADLAAFALALVLPRWLPSNAGRRLLVFAGAFFLNVAFAMDVIGTWSGAYGPGFYFFLGAVPALALYGFKKRDLFTLVVAVLGVFAIGNTLFLRGMHHNETGGFFFLTLVNLIAGGAAAYGLNRLYREWRGPE